MSATYFYTKVADRWRLQHRDGGRVTYDAPFKGCLVGLLAGLLRGHGQTDVKASKVSSELIGLRASFTTSDCDNVPESPERMPMPEPYRWSWNDGYLPDDPKAYCL